jgi:hypothetical protein
MYGKDSDQYIQGICIAKQHRKNFEIKGNKAPIFLYDNSNQQNTNLRLQHYNRTNSNQAVQCRVKLLLEGEIVHSSSYSKSVEKNLIPTPLNSSRRYSESDINDYVANHLIHDKNRNEWIEERFDFLKEKLNLALHNKFKNPFNHELSSSEDYTRLCTLFFQWNKTLDDVIVEPTLNSSSNQAIFNNNSSEHEKILNPTLELAREGETCADDDINSWLS